MDVHRLQDIHFAIKLDIHACSYKCNRVKYDKNA